VRSVALGEIVSDARPGFASGEDTEDGIVQVRMNNVTTEGNFDWSKLRRVPGPRKLDELIVRSNDILLNATNSPDLVGKNAVFRGFSEPVTFSNHFIRIRLDERVADSGFVSRWFTDQWGRGKFKSMCRQWVNQASLNKDQLLSLNVPLPPLNEQRQIAASLDQADDLRRKRREALRRIEELYFATFVEMFGEPTANSKGWPLNVRLGDVAEIVSGITKGRKLNGAHVRSVPYLAVANVQDRLLNLQTVKAIDATEVEITRYRLLKDDLVLTEGGDPDKLGRGALWQNEIAECIHQNHIFRVRLAAQIANPVFVNFLVGGPRGKAYFLKSAKQTTGIASINMTQLREFPLLLPPIELQRSFAARVAEIDKLKALYRTHLARLDILFASLQHRAFRGEL
jgi:type I restriction enzyme, S subunit